MFVNKNMLGGALVVADKFVVIEPDGTVCSMCENALFVAEPILPVTSNGMPFGDKTALRERIILPKQTATEVFKSITVDRLFGGIFENTSISCAEGSEILVKTSNGRAESLLKIRNTKANFVDWRALISAAWRSKRTESLVTCFNRERLLFALEALNSACKYKGTFSPVFEYRCGNGQVIWRSINELTGQHILILFMDAGAEHKLKLSTWENKLFGIFKL